MKCHFYQNGLRLLVKSLLITWNSIKKSRSHFGLLSTTYLIAQRFSLLELQISYFRCPYDIQEKIRSHIEEKWFKEWHAACVDFYHHYSYNIWESWSTTIYFSADLESVTFISQSIHYLPVILSSKLGNMGWFFTSQKSQILISHFSQP